MLTRASKKLRELGLDALLIQNPDSLNWFCPRNHYCIPGVCLLMDGELFVASKFRYLDGIKNDYSDCKDYFFINGAACELLDICREKGARRVGFEAGYATISVMNSLNANGLDMIPTTDFIEELRMVKTPEELLGIRDADALARRIIDESVEPGLQNAGLGHGVGMTVHERPSLPLGGEYIIQANTVLAQYMSSMYSNRITNT